MPLYLEQVPQAYNIRKHRDATSIFVRPTTEKEKFILNYQVLAPIFGEEV
jgi:hypothetical protein